MIFNNLFSRIAKFVLKCCQPYKFVKVDVSQINYGGILNGKNIVVTGGGRGLGFYMAKKFISEGANVIISGRNRDTLLKAQKQLGPKCHYVIFDVTDTNDDLLFLSKCKALFCGEINCLVCNAGISFHEKDIQEVTPEGFDTQFNTNLRGCYFLCQSFIKEKLGDTTSESDILIISSETADMAYDIPYGMTKAGLSTLTKALSRRFYCKGIRVNGIAPGVTLSDMTKYAQSEDGNMGRICAAGRVFLPEEVAEVACFLLSDASKCISGEIIHTNVGNHIRAFWDNIYGNQ